MSAKDIKTGAKKASRKSTNAKQTVRKTTAPTPKRNVVSRSNTKRPPRRPLSTTYKLQLPEGIIEEGYDYRWLLERPERIMQYEAAWWEPVHDDDGKRIRKPSGGGEYLTLYRIESKYHEEDKAENRKKPINLLHDKALLKKDSDSMEYVPEGHDAVVKYS